jgi:hypothetical protein
MNIDLYIASISFFPFFRNDLQPLVLGQDGASFVPGLASPIPCPLLLSFREIHGYTIQYFEQMTIKFLNLTGTLLPFTITF